MGGTDGRDRSETSLIMRSPRRFFLSRLALGVLLLALRATALAAATGHFLILHTNDIHDHVRSGYSGMGGLPYVSGFIRQVRSERQDVLVLDAGDVTEKGDMVAFRTGSDLTYEMMKRIGYDAVTIGNHDFDEPDVSRAKHYEEVLGQPMLNLNLRKPDGSPEFTPSRIVTVAGVRVGIVGLIVPRDKYCLNLEESGVALGREADRLKRDVGVHVVIALCHEGPKGCTLWSRAAPRVDIFVSGHSHDKLPEPVVVPETGASIVQAGSYAEWVGKVEVDVDLRAQRATRVTGVLVPMVHDQVPLDQEMLAQVQRREEEVCPEAREVVATNAAPVDGYAMAWLGAEALRRQAKAEVGFCVASQIIRAGLPAGKVDVNALFLTGGQRGYKVVRTQLTGAEIGAYLDAMRVIQKEQPIWSGFHAVVKPEGDGRSAQTDLEPARAYDVVMPALEWTTRFQRVCARQRQRKEQTPLTARHFTAQPIDITFTGAVRELVAEVVAKGGTLAEEANRIAVASSTMKARSDS